MGAGTTIALIKALAPKVDPAVIEQAVSDWLEDHPEATTTVEDGSITKAKLVAALQAVVDAVPGMKEIVDSLQMLEPLANVYVPQDIANIMDGYILKNGVPETQYGTYFYVSDYVPVTGGDTITFNFAPWGNADSIYRGAEYDDEKNYIGNITNTTQKLSSSAAYIRFSVRKIDFGGTAQLALAYLNENLVISNGERITYTGIDKTLNLFLSDFVARQSDNYYVDASSDELLIISKMSGKNNKDVGVKMKSFTSNDSLQFCSFGTIDNDSPCVSNKPSDYVEFMSTSEDFFSPIIGFADSNGDGDDPTTGKFTGGMHKYNGYNTARKISQNVYFDGREKPGYVGYCNTIDIVVVYNLQVSNTVKSDGTGREVVQQITRLHFENGVIYTETLFKALEPIYIQTFFFMQGNHKPDKMGADGIRYIGSEANRAANSMSENSNSGDMYGKTMRMLSDTLQMDITIDDVDIGRFAHASDYSAFVRTYTNYSKCYFNAIGSSENPIHLDTGDICIAKGSVRLGIFE